MPSYSPSDPTPSFSRSSLSMCRITTRQSLAMPPWSSASLRLLYDSTSWTYLPTNATVTLRLGSVMRLTTSSHADSRDARDQMLSSAASLWSSPCSLSPTGRRYTVSTSTDWNTASVATLQNIAIFLIDSSGSACSQRTTRTSHCTPISRSFWTECWVGLVLNSPAARMYGTSVRCTLTEFCEPSSTRSWRTASRNGNDSMSPTVPPTSTTSTSRPSAQRRMRLLISSVMCGMTCTVEPRYSPRRSLPITDE